MQTLDLEAEKKAHQILLDNGQSHLIQDLEKHSEQERIALVDQINHLQKSIPGGIEQYVQSGRQLLQDSLNGVNPFEGLKAHVPKGKTLSCEKLDELMEYEEIGIQEIKDCCFVLVAGGLGERLGYQGIKIQIEMESVTKQTFLEYYISFIKAYQKRVNCNIPLVIMVSGDTDELTRKFLEENNNFGLEELHVVKQQKVPTMIDNDARFNQLEEKLEIECKPHGHGDVHSLLYQSGLIEKFIEKGKKWLIVFQDTNPAVFRAYPSVLGISKKYDLEMNSITVPRKPGEAIGGIMNLENKEKGINMTLNVEYNQIQSVLDNGTESTDENGYSVYPGNINSIIFSLEDYLKNLQKTKGQIKEFINPKYKDSSKTVFKSSTRLECMMQDYPKQLDSGERVGFSQLDRLFCFTTCKNDLVSAADKQKQGLAPESASSCESDFYLQNAKILQLLGVDVHNDSKQVIQGVEVQLGPKIVLGPEFGVTFKEIQTKLKGNIQISAKSTLVLQNDVTIDGLQLDGSIRIQNHVKDLKVDDQKYVETEQIDVNDHQNSASSRIRGFRMANLDNINSV